MAKQNKDPYKTGNRKCWHIVVGSGVAARGLSYSEAIKYSAEISGAYPCRDGYKLVPCIGEAHSNPHVDNCGVCVPRWGWIMVKDES